MIGETPSVVYIKVFTQCHLWLEDHRAAKLPASVHSQLPRTFACSKYQEYVHAHFLCRERTHCTWRRCSGSATKWEQLSALLLAISALLHSPLFGIRTNRGHPCIFVQARRCPNAQASLSNEKILNGRHEAVRDPASTTMFPPNAGDDCGCRETLRRPHSETK